MSTLFRQIGQIKLQTWEVRIAHNNVLTNGYLPVFLNMLPNWYQSPS